MSIQQFLANPEWDAPFFKRLAHNDTGQAAGNQGGMVLPKDLRQYLPTLDELVTTPAAPTVDRYLTTEMFVGIAHLTERIVRYQFQTWGGTRAAESRLTDGLRPLRNRASEGDIMLFQRRADALYRFRFILVKLETAEFVEITQWINGRPWGALRMADAPVTQEQLTQARTQIVELSQRPFEIQRPTVPRVESRQNRIARSSVFRETVRNEYDRKCAITGITITTPTMLAEVESAHVVPVSDGGTDDIRNGFALTQTVHWAFDQGLLGVLPNHTIYIPPKVKRMPENEFLRQFENRPIAEPKTVDFRVHDDAFRWHMDNRVRNWK